MQNQKTQNQKNNSSLPLAIIGLVLLAAIGGGWWWYSNSKSQSPKSNTNKPTVKIPNDQAALERYRNAPPGAQPANTLGSPSATVTVEEFADYQCPTCGLIYPKIKEINNIYGNRIKFTFHNFPLSMHQHGYEASVAAEAAALQNKFWAMQEQLFTNRQAWENAPDVRKIFEDYAQKIGLDVAKFQSDVAGLSAKSRVDADLERGRQLKVGGTPTIFVNGREIAVEQLETNTLRQIIDSELQKANGQTQPSAPATNQPAETTNQPQTNSNNLKENK